jgi:hypothetical protein
MKLQLSSAAVLRFATLCGPATNDIERDTRRVLEVFSQEGHDPVTRRDVTAVLLAMGFSDCVRGKTLDWNAGPAWYQLGEVLSQKCTQAGRGYWTRRALPPVGEEPSPEPLERPEKPSEARGEAAPEPQAQNVSEAPKKTAEKAPRPAREETLSMKWFREQITQNQLDVRVASTLKKKFHREDFEELVSHVRFHFALWGSEGYCDKFLLAGKPPSVACLAHWCGNKMVQHLFTEGKDALGREIRGARTQKERDRTRETGEEFVFPDSLKLPSDVPRAVKVLKDGGESSWDFVSPPPGPELEEITEGHIGLARDIVRARRARNPEKYARFFDHLVQGRTREETAALEGVSHLQVNSLYSKVKEDLRAAPQVLELALKVLVAISEEPFSTADELREEAELEDKELKLALKFLLLRGLAQEREGESWVLTQGGRKAADLGSLHP